MKLLTHEPDDWRSNAIAETASNLSLSFAKQNETEIPEGLINNPIVGEDAKKAFIEVLDLINTKALESTGRTQEEGAEFELDSFGSHTVVKGKPRINDTFTVEDPELHLHHTSQGITGNDDEEIITLRSNKDNFLTLTNVTYGKENQTLMELHDGGTYIYHVAYTNNEVLGHILMANRVRQETSTVDCMDAEEIYGQVIDWVRKFELPQNPSMDELVQKAKDQHGGKVPSKLVTHVMQQIFDTGQER